MDVKWIKITTNIFDDEKIKIIDTMPARDEILVIWFKLLALAGKVNQSGMLFMNSKIAYTPEMLSAVFNRELNVVKLALSTFSNFGMIEIEDNEIICISNWDKHQNIDGLEKIRLQTNERVKKSREKKKTMLSIGCNATCNATVTQSNAIEVDLELDIEKELIKADVISFITKYKGLKELPVVRSWTDSRKKHIEAKIKEYGINEVLAALDTWSQSDFLKGKNDKKWTADIDWIVKPTNFTKLIEGKYTNKQQQKQQPISYGVIDDCSDLEEIL